MKCCICGKEVRGYGNNPYPLCSIEDHESVCCTECDNKYVIRSRILAMKLSNREIKKGDVVIIFWSNESDSPIKILVDKGKFLAGYVETNKNLPEGCWKGTWGRFILNTKIDTYMVADNI